LIEPYTVVVRLDRRMKLKVVLSWVTAAALVYELSRELMTKTRTNTVRSVVKRRARKAQVKVEKGNRERQGIWQSRQTDIEKGRRTWRIGEKLKEPGWNC